MGWSWPLSIMFGTLVIVTGPTVITPLLRRIKVNHNIQTILEAEGVLIDPVGAIIAIVTLEIIIHPGGGAFTTGLMDALVRLGAGAVMGLAGGFIIAHLMKRQNLVGEGLENVFVLAFVVALYTVCNELKSESGIAAVAVAGVVVGNIKTPVLRDLMDFKEQLTVMLIALLFVLLAADVRLSDVTNLGWPGLITVLVLMILVRPLNILLCTHNSKLTLSEKTFLAWLAPRGIVAAAVTSIAAISLGDAGIEGGQSLRALVFMVIAVTVLVQGLSGDFLAGILRVKRPTNVGYAILGAHELARAIASVLRKSGEPVVLLDANPDSILAAEKEGHRVVFGNALEERTLQRANIGEFATCIALTTNEKINLLFANKVKSEFRLSRLSIAVHERASRISAEMLRESSAAVLFGQPFDIALWSSEYDEGLSPAKVGPFFHRTCLPQMKTAPTLSRHN
jgi:NhaP-type Na+/H+ or K+/H+ antiporter